MSAKVHLHMHVSDLSKSREFYEKFLGGDPVKVKQGYVKFLPAWAPVNLALSTGGPIGTGTINHVGVQVDSVETVMAELTRIKDAGLAVVEEMGVNCCHANQDKFWVKDPDGVEWEVYHRLLRRLLLRLTYLGFWAAQVVGLRRSTLPR
jgi:lactoylglutathione lyase